MKKTDYRRELIREDCLEVFRNGDIEAGSVDLIYLDPPFNSQQKYNLPFKKLGKDAEAVEAFKDIWHWDESTKDLYRQLSEDKETVALKNYIDNLSTLRGGRDDMSAYLVNMAIRLFEMRKVLKPTGSIYLHCDSTASHYLKIMMDAIYGKGNYINEIIWNYGKWTNAARHFQKNHDTLLLYAKGDDRYVFNKLFNDEDVSYHYKKGWHTNVVAGGISQLIVYNKRKAAEKIDSGRYDKIVFREGKTKVALPDVWHTAIVNPQAEERIGYPTQKPLKLLKLIIKASSNEGDIILDPFCGCGTTIHAAENLGRQWIGIDISRFSIGVMKNRLRRSFESGAALIDRVQIRGLPLNAHTAKKLVREDPWEFEKWVCGYIGATGLYKNPGQKGADSGIDGVINFHLLSKAAHGKSHAIKSYAVVQVKGGKVSPNDVKALYADVEREPVATAGVFVCFEEYRKTFENNQSHKKFKDAVTGREYPLVQLLTIEEMLAGKEPHLPNIVLPKEYKMKKSETMSMFDGTEGEE